MISSSTCTQARTATAGRSGPVATPSTPPCRRRRGLSWPRPWGDIAATREHPTLREMSTLCAACTPCTARASHAAWDVALSEAAS